MDKELNVAGGVEVIDSSGDVFADLGIPSSVEDTFKIALARAITNTVRKRDLTQIEVAKIIEVNQAEVSKILSGRLRGFSVERLMRMLVSLGHDVDMHISARHRNRPGRLRVRAA